MNNHKTETTSASIKSLVHTLVNGSKRGLIAGFIAGLAAVIVGLLMQPGLFISTRPFERSLAVRSARFILKRLSFEDITRQSHGFSL